MQPGGRVELIDRRVEAPGAHGRSAL
jgi:hypothetical protein